MRSRRVFLLRRNLPRRDEPQMSVKPRKLKVSGRGQIEPLIALAAGTSAAGQENEVLARIRMRFAADPRKSYRYERRERVRTLFSGPRRELVGPRVQPH